MIAKNVVYVCERCAMVIGRTSTEIVNCIKMYGGMFCKRCVRAFGKRT